MLITGFEGRSIECQVYSPPCDNLSPFLHLFVLSRVTIICLIMKGNGF